MLGSQSLILALAVLAALANTGRADDATTAARHSQAPEVMPFQVRGAATAARAEIDWSVGPMPQWIWGVPGAGPCVVKTKFPGGAQTARLKATCDNAMRLYLNGRLIASSEEWQSPVEVDVLANLKPGENEILAELDNVGGVSGFILKLVMQMSDGSSRYVVTGGDWMGAAARDAADWSDVRVLAKHGDGPWGDILTQQPALAGGVPREVFELPEGFQVERLFTVPKEELGSWVCLTVDPRGRLLASDQGKKGICRITPAPIAREPGADASPAQSSRTLVEKLDLDISAAQGMLCAFGYLYLSVNDGGNSGLYRARYDEAADQYGPVEKLHGFRGAGEHGPHALRLSPDGKSIYIIAGNHTKLPFEIERSAEPQTMGGVRSELLTASLPEGMSSRRLPNWDEDLLLPREWDARGHARGILAPGGWIAKTDPEGKTWEIVSTGYRNTYDMAFNADGELFAYDADMEWDMGMPWYRPTRICHATSGSEFGWRSGTGKWPIWYLDSLPPAVEIGPGSPVGVEFGYGTKFPEKYQRALFACDWTFGTMYAVHLTPEGSSYTGVKEEFLSRTPLPLTDVAVGADGALYFTTGGRGTQSELFRMTYAGEESTAPADVQDHEFAAARRLRQTIEQFHTDAVAERAADPQFSDDFNAIAEGTQSGDRFLRYASLVAGEWILKAAVERGGRIRNISTDADFRDLISASMIAARAGTPASAPPLLKALQARRIDRLSERELLDYLRALSLVFIRLGAPDGAARNAFIEKLDPLYPSGSASLNREVVQMLVFLESPTIVNRAVGTLSTPTPSQGETAVDPLLARNRGYGGTIADMLANQPDAERIWTAFVLRNARVGWTLDLRMQFYKFLSEAREWKGGASFQGFLSFIDNDVWDATPEKERIAIEGAGLRKPFLLPELPKPKGPGHAWTLDEVLARAANGLQRGRDFKNGERAYAAARCIVCHRFAGDGGATGPDLTQLAGRFNLKDLAEAILDPGKVVSDQYRATTLVTEGGKVYTGRVLDEAGETVSILIDPEDASKVVDVPRDEIAEMQPAAASLMPADLLKPLSEEEVLDLLAYLLSRGDEGSPMFRKR